jgi:hypothetical protein
MVAEIRQTPLSEPLKSDLLGVKLGAEKSVWAWQWLARATNTGPLADGNPPTGRSLTMPGASFTQVEGDKIRSEQVYHDQKTMDEQLGLKPK